ncbi:Beta-1,3-galactosyltransferase brn [Mizuhopecten yessoensis]|uniref:Beta-1,3-galactosyltransferase brn n=1 Tax=Mizuhopecten yessoensis TaxID=6573 RepID=A0A210QK26_MIZYE|nr:Beta-1,3-galactosyltransferase brn [Mizuhopecten yessoensis]
MQMQGKCVPKRKGILRVLAGLVAFTALSVFVELSVADWRYDIVANTNPEPPQDVLVIDIPPTAIPVKKEKIVYQSYEKDFAYPSFVNLSALVAEATRKNMTFIQNPPINYHPYRYNNVPANCRLPMDGGSTKRILIIVKSFVGNVEMRVAIRSLWEKIKDPYMALVFMLGEYPKENNGRRWPIDRENRIYKDLIQENFDDSYFNNTLKTIMGFNWAVNKCPQADLLLFHDDDYHVKYTNLSIHLRKVLAVNKTNIYSGSLAVKARPYRNRGERWFVTIHQYPFDVFPPYVGGGAYVVSADVARKFQMAFPHVRYLSFDDVYLGIVARKLDIIPTSDMLLDTLYPDALAQECSHKANELFRGQCPLAIKKRQIANTPEIVEESETNNTDNSSAMPYLSFENSFSFPLEANIRSAINGKIIHNHRINLRNINAHPYLYISEPAECKFAKHSQNIIVFVKSYVKNVEQRAAIRRMWNESLQTHSTSLKLVFLLGQGIYPEDKPPVEAEVETHKDILQEDFTEHYRNNTYKVVMALNWVMANKACFRTRLLLFLDDDYYVHQKELLTYLHGLSNHNTLFLGKVMKKQVPCRLERDKRNLVYKQYPFDMFPDYIKGGVFLLSFEVARKFQLSFPYVKYLPLDDVYLGIVAWKLHIDPKHDLVFDTSSRSALTYECSHVAARLIKGKCPLRGEVDAKQDLSVCG